MGCQIGADQIGCTTAFLVSMCFLVTIGSPPALTVRDAAPSILTKRNSLDRNETEI